MFTCVSTICVGLLYSPLPSWLLLCLTSGDLQSKLVVTLLIPCQGIPWSLFFLNLLSPTVLSSPCNLSSVVNSSLLKLLYICLCEFYQQTTNRSIPLLPPNVTEHQNFENIFWISISVIILNTFGKLFICSILESSRLCQH